MITGLIILCVVLFLSSLCGWTFFVLEVRLSKTKDEVLESSHRAEVAAEATIKALRTQNARLMVKVAELRVGVNRAAEDVKNFKLEEGK